MNAPLMKAYLDNNVVCAIVKDDQRSESAAISRLLEVADEGKVQLVTSEVTLQEIRNVPEKYRTPLERTFRLLKKIPILKWDELLFITNFTTGNVTMNSPVIRNEPQYDSLLRLGLDVVDARHLFVASQQHCAAFITCDNSPGTSILRRGRDVQALTGMAVQRPAQFLQSQGV